MITRWFSQLKNAKNGFTSTSYHRKHAIRLFRGEFSKQLPCRRRARYDRGGVQSLCRNLGGAAGTGAVENGDSRSVAFGGSAVFCSFGRMAGRLGVEARKLHKLVLVKEAAPIYHGP